MVCNKALSALTVCMLILAGCGGGDSKESREAQIESEAKRYGVDADVKLDDDGNVSSAQIRTVSGTVGRNLKVPNDFPGDVPIHHSWDVMSISKAPQGGYMVQSTTKDGIDKLVAQVREALVAEGWVETAYDQPMAQMARLNFEKDGRMTNVNLMDGGNSRTTVQLLTMDIPGQN